MQQVVLLDANPLSQVTHPKIKPEVRNWMQSLRENNIALKSPEISVYEVRRELIRLNNNKSIERLNQFISWSAFGKVALKISCNLAFDVFPQVNQIICGGVPKRLAKSTKSLSLVMKITP